LPRRSETPAGRCERPGKLERIFVSNNWIHIIVWAVVIGGVFGLLWWQGQIQRLALYVAQTREELRKCTWPTVEELKGQTALIFIMIALLGGFIVLIDSILTQFFSHQ